MAEAPTITRPASGLSGRAGDAPPRLLVVDDEPAILSGLTIRLQSAGYQVDTAVDAPSALRTAALHPPDLAVLDRRLPGMHGDELATELRRTVGPTTLPVIMLTANPAGLDPNVPIGPPLTIVNKPYEASDLLHRIRRRLEANPPDAR